MNRQKEYHKKYYEANKEKINERERKYYEANKDKEGYKERRKKHNKKYQEDNKDKTNARRRKRHEENKDKEGYKEKRREQQKVVAKKYRDWIGEIKLRYGCTNPNCTWVGDFKPHMLEFHHLDEKTKLFNLGSSLKKKSQAIKEINKCIVLCSNCHKDETWGDLDVSNFEKCCE